MGNDMGLSDRLRKQMTVSDRAGRLIDVAIFALGLVALIALGAFFSAPHAKAADGEVSVINAVNANAYKFDRQDTVFRSSVSVVDTAATNMSDANLALTPQLDIGGRKNVSVSPHFTANSSATVSVMLVMGWQATPGGAITGVRYLGPVTLTAPASAIRKRNDGAGGTGGTDRYVGETYVFDSLAGNVGWLIVTTAPSSGNVSFWTGTY